MVSEASSPSWYGVSKKITLSQHDDAVLTKIAVEEFATFLMTIDSSRRAVPNDTNIDVVFFQKVLPY